VKKLLSMAIKAAAKGKYVGICGQGPSDHPDLAEWLMQEGIESVSLNPDTVVDTWLRLAKPGRAAPAEQAAARDRHRTGTKSVPLTTHGADRLVAGAAELGGRHRDPADRMVASLGSPG
jgi:phosphoenolpyruvate-protein kinase (PTS system EI component)